MDFEYLVLKVSEIDGKAPAIIQILPIGDHIDGRGRRFHVGPEQIQSILTKFAQRENDLVIDYEHHTLEPGVIAPAAGWIKRLEDRGELGLWAEVEWTDRGKQFIEGKEYRYLSPVLIVRKKDKSGSGLPEELHSAALTNDPAIDGMVPLINKVSNNKQKENDMQEFVLKLKKLLGLKEEATEEETVEALTVLKNKAEKPEIKSVLTKEVIEALKLEEVMEVLQLKAGATASEVKATILAMKQGARAVENLELDKVKKELAFMKAETLVNSAMKEGKITAAQKEWAEDYAKQDPEGFKVYVSKATRVVPLDLSPKPPEQEAGEVDEITLEIAAQFGNSKEDLVKFGGIKESA